MNKSIASFIEENVQGEPLTPDVVAWAIRKYIYMNYLPTKQDKLDMYEALLHDIATSVSNGDGDVKKYVTNIRNWDYARTSISAETDNAEHVAIQNETFYNLRKL